MTNYKEFKDSLKTIKYNGPDHAHFTNECFICNQITGDEMIPVKVTRNGYIENDYCCHACYLKVTEKK